MEQIIKIGSEEIITDFLELLDLAYGNLKDGNDWFTVDYEELKWGFFRSSSSKPKPYYSRLCIETNENKNIIITITAPKDEAICDMIGLYTFNSINSIILKRDYNKKKIRKLINEVINHDMVFLVRL